MFDEKTIGLPRHIKSTLLPHDILNRINSGESDQTEFKRLVHSPEKIAKSLVAFANTRGGIILIGVDDDKRIVGIESEKELHDVIDDAAQCFTQPEVKFDYEILEFRGRDIGMITVHESSTKPHFHLSEVRDPKTFKKNKERRVYLRSGSQNVLASFDQIELLKPLRKPLTISFGEKEKILFKYLDAYQRITLQQYSKLVGISYRRASRILLALVRAGVIMLHTEGKISYYTHPLKGT